MKTLLLLTSISPLSAALITANSGSPSDTAGYTWNIALDSANDDNTTFVGSVGSWSWEDKDLNEDPSLGGNNNIGWRHQSDWIAVSLTNATRLSIKMERFDASSNLALFPSFTIYESFTSITDKHFYENDRDLSWDPALLHHGHLANSTLNSGSMTLDLPAGDYTLVLGGNSTSQTSSVNVNYRASLTAAPVPEPSSVALSLLAGLSLLARRKR